MSTLRPQNECRDCSYTWYPRGHNISLQCPNCGSNDIDTVGLGCLAQLVITGIVGIIIAVGLGALDGEDAKDVPQNDDMRTHSKVSENYQAPQNLVIQEKEPQVLTPNGYSKEEFEGCKIWVNAHPSLAKNLKPSDRCFPIAQTFITR